MKIVFLTASGQLGGAERLLLDLIGALREYRPGWDLRVVIAREGPFHEAVAALGVQAIVLPFPPALAGVGDSGGAFGGLVRGAMALAGSAGYALELRRVLRDIGPDVIHSNGYKMDVLGAWSRTAGTPLLWHLHDFLGTRPLMASLLRAHVSSCAVAIANSRAVAEDARRTLGDSLSVEVVLNGVDLCEFAPEGERLDLDALAGISKRPDDTVRVGLVATMGRFKGHETFLRAIAVVDDVHVMAYVVGGPIYDTHGSQVTLEHLHAVARGLGIEDRVAFTGFAGDTASAIRALDIVVHATTQPEPFGLVIAEAMACGRAVIVSAAGGAAEIIRAGVDALAFEPGDAAGLADRIRTLARDSDLRVRLGAAGRESALARFDRKRLAREMASVYERVAARRRA
jgi:glycosyltransferase involved in cell wall biosynthesis